MKIFNPEDAGVREAVVIASLEEWKEIVEIVCKESENHPKRKRLKILANQLSMLACY